MLEQRCNNVGTGELTLLYRSHRYCQTQMYCRNPRSEWMMYVLRDLHSSIGCLLVIQSRLPPLNFIKSPPEHTHELLQLVQRAELFEKVGNEGEEDGRCVDPCCTA
jgi:hypothetical protein